MAELQWPLTLTGRLEVSLLNRPGPDAKVNLTNQNIYGMFLSAMEESLTITLANTCRAIRVAHMIWIIPTESQEDEDAHDDTQAEYALLTLRTQISAIGNLLLLPEVVLTNLSIASKNNHNAKTVLLAPSGTLTSTADHLSSLSLGDGQEDGFKGKSQMRREARSRLAKQAREEKWIASVKTRLANTVVVPLGLNQPSTWTRIKIPTPKTSNDALARFALDRSATQTCLWPTKLCFEKSNQSHISTATATAQNYYMDWFTSGTYKDPLESAEDWFKKEPEREDAAVADQTRDNADADKEAAASQTLNPPTDQVALSSPVNIRPQDQINLNGIYPTPPDGILAGVFADVAASAGTAEDVGPSTVTDDYTLTRHPSNVSQSMLDADMQRKNSTDELFGDMDEEMFGVDVTIDDFDFFNENDAPVARRRRSSNRVEGVHEIAAKQHLPAITNGADSHDPPTASVTASDTAVETAQDAEMDNMQTVATSHPGDASNAESQPTKETNQGTALSFSKLPSYSPQHQIPERLRTPPLSPFQIKEKFLPSPVPASSVKSTDGFRETLQSRRSSHFNPVTFKGDISSFDAKYRNLGRFGGSTSSEQQDVMKPTGPTLILPGRSQSIISLPPRLEIPKQRKPVRSAQHSANTETYNDSSSYESDTDSASSVAESEVPASTFGKRKRMLADDGASMHSYRTNTDIESDIESTISEDKSAMDYGPLLDLLLSREGQKDYHRTLQENHKFDERPSVWKSLRHKRSTSTESKSDMWDVFSFNQEDMICIAQIVAQQNITIESDIKDDNEPELLNALPCEDQGRTLKALSSVVQDAVRCIFSSSSDCDFSKLASVISAHAEQHQMQRNPHQPKPAQTPRRAPNGSTGAQHLFAISPPSVHLQRAGSAWEMLPSSVKFWEPLGLEPASGRKDVTAYGIYPECGDLGLAVQDFLDDVGLAYGNCKLGDHVRGATYSEYNDGLVGFSLPEEAISTRSLLVSMHTACVAFGQLLSEESLEVDRPVVIYMFSPSHHETLIKYMCACFWAFQQAFLVASDAGDDMPDFILQIVPIDQVASSVSLTVPEPTWLASLACQVYDRIPIQEPIDPKSVWMIPSAPSIQLISPVPRKINFTLHECPPKSLLEEAQILHVAYAISNDNSWLTAAWSDNTGHYQFNTSFWIKDLDGKAILAEVRDMTLALAKITTFRIFVARVGTMRIWERDVWKEQPSDTYAIVLLDVDTNPILHISSTEATANHPAVPHPGAGFLTPTSMSQQSTTFGVSPEAQSATPSTPLPLDTDPPPPDPDAYLIDATDETWGLVIPFSAVHGPYELKRCLASGVLLKRGPADVSTLPSLGVDIIDMLMPKVGEGQANWLSMKTPDAVLREVLSWYRGLGLLSRLRGVDRTGVVPWHVKVAVLGVEALEGFLE